MFARLLALSSAIALGIGGSAAAQQAEAPRDNVVASWGGHCSNHVQCWIDIEPAGSGRYTVVFKAAAQLNDNKVICTLKTVMERGGRDFITGRLGSSLNVGVFIKKPGLAIVHGAPSDPCPVKLHIDGEYNVIAD
jgi:hypothetical protein